MKYGFSQFRAQSLSTVGAAMLTLTIAHAAGAGVVDPANITLADRNSSLHFDLTSDTGNNSWLIDGQQKLKKQWFWYRVGDAAESSIDKLSRMGPLVTDTNPFSDDRVDTMGVLYREQKVGQQDGRFEIELSFTLRGGESGDSDLTEAITIRNRTDAPLNFSFFQYVDLDLGATDSVQFTNANAVRQTGVGGSANESVITPPSSHREAAVYGSTLDKLNDGSATTLSDAVSAPDGDVTWAYEWDVVIPARGSFQISKDKRIVIPEPGTITLGLLGASMLAAARRRKA